MFSPRIRAQLGLGSAAFMLIATVSVLLHGREGLRPQPGKMVAVQPNAGSDAVAMGAAPKVEGR